MSSEIKPRIVYLLKRTDTDEDDEKDRYVGSTSVGLKERLRLHRCSANYMEKHKNTKLYVKMREIGVKNWGPSLSYHAPAIKTQSVKSRGNGSKYLTRT